MEQDERGSLQETGRLIGNKINGKVVGSVKGAGKKLLKKCLIVLIPLIIILLAIVIVYGGATSLTDAIQDFFDSSTDLSSMSESERYQWINDPENIYNELQKSDSTLDLSNSNLSYMNKETIEQIFDRLHVYEDRSRETSGQISYGNRVESYSGSLNDTADTVGMEPMDEYGTIRNDNNSIILDSNASVAYDTQYRYTEIRRSDVEGVLDANGIGVFETRWQPIYVVCAMAARNNYENHQLQNGQDFSTTDFDDISLDGYFLTDEQIDAIIDIFTYEFEYFYDPVSSARVTYGFKSFEKKPSAYRVLTDVSDYYDYSSEDGSSSFTRTTYRVPEAAPKRISNSYVTYSYNYVNNICVSRDYAFVPNDLIAACEEHCQDFDFNEFLELLAQLPGTEDLVEYYSRFVATENGYMPEFTTTTSREECPSIGVIYSPGGGLVGDTDADIGSTGQEGWVEWDGEVEELIYYDYINGNIHRIAVKVPGEDYGIYEVHSTALKSYYISDELTVDQLVYLFDTDSTFSRSSNILFSSDANKYRTAQKLVEVQNEKGISVLFFLGIMKIEGAIGTNKGEHWNFFNIEASSQYGRPPIDESPRFCDYTQLYSNPWDALAGQINSIHTWYSRYNQTSAFQFIFAGYTEPNWSLIYHSYCPPWDDLAFPWDVGSGMGTPNGMGWANRVGDFRYGFEQAILGM